MGIVLSINDLTKRYGKFTALNGLNLEVKAGEVFGLLGPNGSGKTTTLGILLGVLNATEGSFSWFENGQKDENRIRIGSLLETPNFFPYMNAVDNLQVIAKIKRLENPDAAIQRQLERVDLWERRNFRFGQYSLGMKQRLAIAAAMLNDPEVLVLDEPTNGLDPQGIAEMRKLILEIASTGKTIILASHILDEVEKICTHVAILRKGQLLTSGTMKSILTAKSRLLLSANDPAELESALRQMSDIEVNETTDGMIAVTTDVFAGELNKRLAEKGIYLSGLTEQKKNLESTFLELIES